MRIHQFLIVLLERYKEAMACIMAPQVVESLRTCFRNTNKRHHNDSPKLRRNTTIMYY